MNIITQRVEDQGNGQATNLYFDQVYEELLTELLKNLTNQQSSVQRSYKSQIEKIFQTKGFFSMSERSLRKWQIIMRQYLSNNTELWTDLLRSFDAQGGFFQSKDREIRNQADVFRQLSFLIFSTKKDQINDQLDPLLKKMADSFKRDKKQQLEFTQSLFLLSRILMLRLGSRKLAEALKRLWPHLLAELVTVFESTPSPALASSPTTPQTKKSHYMLTKEAIKVVELMSQLNIDEFQMNQWMFMFDGFGILYQDSDKVAELAEHDGGAL